MGHSKDNVIARNRLAATAALSGPPLMPVLGWRGNMVLWQRDPITYFCRAHAQYGDLCSFATGLPRWLMTFNPEHTRQMLTNPDLFVSKPFIDAPPNSALERVTSGLLSMNGAQHRQHRRLMLPTFHKKRVDAYRDGMVSVVQRVLDDWRVGQQRDMALEMRRITMQIVGAALFGLDETTDVVGIGALVKRWLLQHESVLSFMLPYDRPGLPYRRLLRLSAQLEARFQAMITEKRRRNAADDDVLSLLIAARDEDGTTLTDAELIGHVSVLFIAGYETSSNALTWTLFLLAQHPRVLVDLHDELVGALHGDAPTVAQLAQLPLLERVIKESMRLLPPASYSFRASTAPFEMGGHAFGAQTALFFSQYVTHHSPEIYAEPERFRPDRWLTIDPSPYEYMPFGAGPRMCIGATFAMMEIKIALAVILQRYRLAMLPNARIDRQVKITLSPKRGMPMLIAPQDREFARSQAPVRGNIHEMVDLR